MLPIIERKIRAGSIIHSDGWAAYVGVENIDVFPEFTHDTVNHSLFFVDPVSGVHTNNVECFWKNMKLKFKRMCGVHSTKLQSHLDEFLWRNIHSNSLTDTWRHILEHIAGAYPTP